MDNNVAPAKSVISKSKSTKPGRFHRHVNQLMNEPEDCNDKEPFTPDGLMVSTGGE